MRNYRSPKRHIATPQNSNILRDSKSTSLDHAIDLGNELIVRTEDRRRPLFGLHPLLDGLYDPLWVIFAIHMQLWIKSQLLCFERLRKSSQKSKTHRTFLC